MIRTTLLALLLALFLSVSAVGTASASSTEYVVDLECPEMSEGALDQDLDLNEDYFDCIADREEAEIARSSGFRTINNFYWAVSQIENGGETLENSRFGPVRSMGDSVTDWSDEQHERLDAKKQSLVESTALEQQDDPVA